MLVEVPWKGSRASLLRVEPFCLLGDDTLSSWFNFIFLKDNFSIQAKHYAKYRPGYPQELFDFIIGRVADKHNAWDCGTGNGQTARVLANYFDKVFATDISQTQLENAYRSPQILYSLQAAEQTEFADNFFDLVTVSQALHWFKLDAFYAEVNRVSKPGGWLAAWTYSLLNISPEIDDIINLRHYKKRLGDYWDPERKYVDEEYRTLPFPFREIQTPAFEIHLQWSLPELTGYLETWSALQKFIRINRFDPIPELVSAIKPFWKTEKMQVIFPLHLRMGQVEK